MDFRRVIVHVVQALQPNCIRRTKEVLDKLLSLPQKKPCFGELVRMVQPQHQHREVELRGNLEDGGVDALRPPAETSVNAIQKLRHSRLSRGQRYADKVSVVHHLRRLRHDDVYPLLRRDTNGLRWPPDDQAVFCVSGLRHLNRRSGVLFKRFTHCTSGSNDKLVELRPDTPEGDGVMARLGVPHHQPRLLPSLREAVQVLLLCCRSLENLGNSRSVVDAVAAALQVQVPDVLAVGGKGCPLDSRCEFFALLCPPGEQVPPVPLSFEKLHASRIFPPSAVGLPRNCRLKVPWRNHNRSLLHGPAFFRSSALNKHRNLGRGGPCGGGLVAPVRCQHGREHSVGLASILEGDKPERRAVRAEPHGGSLRGRPEGHEQRRQLSLRPVRGKAGQKEF
eukprot:RCo028869